VKRSTLIPKICQCCRLPLYRASTTAVEMATPVPEIMDTLLYNYSHAPSYPVQNIKFQRLDSVPVFTCNLLSCGQSMKQARVINSFCLDCHPLDFHGTNYAKDVLKSRGDELIHMAAADVEDVRVAERHCRPLCAILSSCYNTTQRTKYEVIYHTRVVSPL
jgi:hypothetical protein